MIKNREKELTDYDMLMACISNDTLWKMGRDVARTLTRYAMSDARNDPDLRQQAWKLYRRYLVRNPKKAHDVKDVQNSSRCKEHLESHMRDILEQEGMDALTATNCVRGAAEITKLLFYVFFDTNHFTIIYEPVDVTFQIELHRYAVKINIMLRLFAEESAEPHACSYVLDYSNGESLYYLDGVCLLNPNSFERGMIRTTGHKITWDQIKNESITQILSRIVGRIVEVITYD